jgi:hypothetical protein
MPLIIQPQRLPQLCPRLIILHRILNVLPHRPCHLFPLPCDCTSLLPLLLHRLSLLLGHLLRVTCLQALKPRADLSPLGLQSLYLCKQVDCAELGVEGGESAAQGLGGGGQVGGLVAEVGDGGVEEGEFFGGAGAGRILKSKMSVRCGGRVG